MGACPPLTAPRRKTQITSDEFGNNGITIVNAIAQSVHFYSRGLRSQLRLSRISFPASSMDSRSRQCRKRVGLFFERLDPGDTIGTRRTQNGSPPADQRGFLFNVLAQPRTGQLHMAGVPDRQSPEIGHSTLAGSHARGDAHNQRHRIVDVFCLARSRRSRFASRDHGEC